MDCDSTLFDRLKPIKSSIAVQGVHYKWMSHLAKYEMLASSEQRLMDDWQLSLKLQIAQIFTSALSNSSVI